MRPHMVNTRSAYWARRAGGDPLVRPTSGAGAVGPETSLLRGIGRTFRAARGLSRPYEPPVAGSPAVPAQPSDPAGRPRTLDLAAAPGQPSPIGLSYTRPDAPKPAARFAELAPLVEYPGFLRQPLPRAAGDVSRVAPTVAPLVPSTWLVGGWR